MNILLAHKYFFRGGGTATYLFSLMEELQARGHRPVPFSVAYRRTAPTPYLKYFVSPPCGADATFYSDIPRTPANAIRLLGRATFSTEAYRKAKQVVAAEHIDIAYVHNVYNYMSPSVIPACRSAGVPVVMRVSDYNLVCPAFGLYRGGTGPCVECLQRGLHRSLVHRCVKGSLAATGVRVFSMLVHRLLGVYRGVDAFVCPSSFMRRTLVAAGFPAEKVIHLPSFFPVNGHLPARLGQGRHILYLGRLSREKGVETLIRAHRMLPHPPPLLIAGESRDGELARLEAIAGEASKNGIKFLGLKGREELTRLIDDALFTVVPSLQHDNCPMSVLESFAQGKPVVGSRLGGIPEQLAGGCGLLFEPGDVRGLARQMQTLLERPQLRREMGTKALARLRSEYTAERHLGHLLSLFERLLERRRAAAGAGAR